MEHAPYQGSGYGNNGKPKVAIMGYSHYDRDTPDGEDKTLDVLAGVIAGNHPPTQFFHQIAGYFGEQGDDFWNDVAFFNFGPRTIGESEHKHDGLNADDLRDAKARFLRLLEQLQPDMLFVFTRKGWKTLPPSEEDTRGTSGAPLIAGQEFDRHHYRLTDGTIVQAFGLRHPERATKQVMRDAVTAALAMRPAPPA